MIPSSVSALVRARRVPAYSTADIDRQVKLIATRRAQHKNVDAELATLRLMRAAQLKASVKAGKPRRSA